MKQAKKRTAVTVRSTGEDAYFAASNSAGGFKSYYPACFDHSRVGRLYAVKGGPGTGKSRFLRAVAVAGVERGWRAEYVYCSSDPDSLDGVILTREGRAGIALLDATAPHVYEPDRPGYREEIVNLGAFWNSDFLQAHAEEIAALNRAKRAAYGRAYRYLAGYGEMSEVRDELVAPYLRREAIRAYAERLAKDWPQGSGADTQTALICSVGMQGAVAFDTYFALAKTRWMVADCRGSADLLLRDLRDLAAEKQLKMRISFDPLLPEKSDGLFLPEVGAAFVVERGSGSELPHRRVEMRRFVETGTMRAVRGEVNFAERMRRAMLEGALNTLREVRRAHFAVEEIYIRAMDFGAKEQFTASFCHSVFGK